MPDKNPKKAGPLEEAAKRPRATRAKRTRNGPGRPRARTRATRSPIPCLRSARNSSRGTAMSIRWASRRGVAARAGPEAELVLGGGDPEKKRPGVQGTPGRFTLQNVTPTTADVNGEQTPREATEPVSIAKPYRHGAQGPRPAARPELLPPWPRRADLAPSGARAGGVEQCAAAHATPPVPARPPPAAERRMNYRPADGDRRLRERTRAPGQRRPARDPGSDHRGTARWKRRHARRLDSSERHGRRARGLCADRPHRVHPSVGHQDHVGRLDDRGELRASSSPSSLSASTVIEARRRRSVAQSARYRPVAASKRPLWTAATSASWSRSV